MKPDDTLPVADEIAETSQGQRGRTAMTRRKLFIRASLLILLAALIYGGVVWLPRVYTSVRVGQLQSRLSESTDFPTRIKTIYQLGEMGKDAQPAVDTLIVILTDDPDPHIRSSAAIALGKIGNERAAGSIRRWMSQMEAEGKRTLVTSRLASGH